VQPPRAAYADRSVALGFHRCETAEQLNQRGWHTYEGLPFTAARVVSFRRYHQLKDHGTRLTERGLLSAMRQPRHMECVEKRSCRGQGSLVSTYRINDRGMLAFPPPDEHAPVKHAHKYQKKPAHYAEGVQYESNRLLKARKKGLALW